MPSLLWLLSLTHMWGLPATKSDNAFVEPSGFGSNVEFYDTKNARYEFHLEKLTFIEAHQVCKSHKGSLLELRNSKVADFIAAALAESQTGHSSLWIGGTYTPATATEEGVWRWLSGHNMNEAPIPEGFKFPMDTPPYWVDRPDLKSTETSCLVTDRCLHSRPLVTGLPCNVKRPFICTVPPANSTEEPQELSALEVSKTKIFRLYHAEVTWLEAFAMCQNYGYQLAVITKQDEFSKVHNRMQRVRPIIENAWTSGAFIDGKWIWVTNNEEISTKTSPNSTDNPPWYKPDNIAMEGCLLADRHVCDYFVYVEARCDRRRSFICQQESQKEDDVSIKWINGTNLFVSTLKLSWTEAQQKCAECLKGGTLFQLAFHDADLLARQIKWLYKAMTFLFGVEIRHLWMNGYLHGDQFKWGNKDTPIDDPNWNMTISDVHFSNASTSLLGDKGEDGYIVFCPGNFKTDPYLRKFKCLNLDRENIKYFFMYGLACEYKQHFVCMVEDGDGKSYIISDTCKNPIEGIGALDDEVDEDLVR